MQKNSATTCPCCGTKVERDKPLVDLNSNTVSFHGAARVTPLTAEMIFVLAKDFERFVPLERIVTRVYGGRDDVETPANIIRVMRSRAKHALAEAGLKIESQYGVGYRLVSL